MSKKQTKLHPHHVPLAAVFVIAIVAVLTFALLYVWRAMPSRPRTPTRPLPPVPAAPAIPETPPPVVAPPPQETSGPIRERPAGTVCDDRNFICVEGSVSGTRLTSPFTVKGSGIAFENTINWRLLGGYSEIDRGVIEAGFVTADAPDIGQAGNFEIRAFILDVPSTPTGTLEVFEYSAKDGTPIHIVRVPVKFTAATMNTRIYIPKQPVGNDCSVVEVREHTVMRSSLPVETALQRLLKRDQTPSAIPAGTRLISLKVSGGTAIAVFSPELENYGGGSCNAIAIRAQIEQTLKQFSSVKRVEISVVGKTSAETLQP